MAVPTHDQRDYEFAKAHNIEMIQVLEGDVSEHALKVMLLTLILILQME